MRYVLSVVAEHAIEGEYGTVDKVLCIDSPLSIVETTEVCNRVAAHNYRNRYKGRINFMGIEFTTQKPWEDMVVLESIETLDAWFDRTSIKGEA